MESNKIFAILKARLKSLEKMAQTKETSARVSELKRTLLILNGKYPCKKNPS